MTGPRDGKVHCRQVKFMGCPRGNIQAAAEWTGPEVRHRSELESKSGRHQQTDNQSQGVAETIRGRVRLTS